MSRPGINSVFYAESYHPIQAGSIDGTDILPHDNAIYRAHLCSSAGLYEPFGDANVAGDPYCTLFVGRLSHLTTQDTLHKAMSKYGRVKNLRLVRHIVTGASRGYAFVEFSSEREMRRAYEDAHHSLIDDYEIIVDYNRQQLMPGWIPRRLGGGLGGKKESGQLRFGGRERPFRAPLRPIPFDDLKRLGIPPPPEGRYMSRFQVPSPPRRSSKCREEASHRRISMDREEDSHRRGRSLDLEEHSQSKITVEREEDREERRHRKRSREREREREREERHSKRSSRDKTTMEGEGRSSPDREEHGLRKRSREREREERHSKKSSRDKATMEGEGRSSPDREENGHRKRSRGREREEDYSKRRSRDKESHERSSMDREERHNRRQEHGGKSHRHEKLSSQDQLYDHD